MLFAAILVILCPELEGEIIYRYKSGSKCIDITFYWFTELVKQFGICVL